MNWVINKSLYNRRFSNTLVVTKNTLTKCQVETIRFSSMKHTEINKI